MASERIYDITFKRMFRLSSKLLIKFVNQIFDKDFPINAKITFLDVNTENEDNLSLEKNLYFEICGEKFQIEAQSYWDDMMFRLFEYAVNSSEDNYVRTDSTHAIFRMPKQAVVFLKDTNKENDRLFIKLILPDEQEVEYSVKAVRALGYNSYELADNNLEILLPFQILRMWNKVKGYDLLSKTEKDAFLSCFSKMCEEIVTVLDSLLNKGNITNDEYKQILLIIFDLKEYLYGNITDISEKGADSMIQERIILSYDKAKAEGKDEQAKKMAEEMLNADEPVVKIERYTGLTLESIIPIAKSLGKNLSLS